MSSSNSFQETHYERVDAGGGPVNKMGSSCCCSVSGFFLYLGMLYMLAWNEQRTVCVERAVIAAESQLTEVKCSAKPGDHQGELVFGSCAVNEDSFQEWTPASFGMDGLSDLFKEKALRIEQQVEMMQCEQIVHRRAENSRDGTEKRVIITYTYEKRWKSSWIDSGRFKQSRVARDALRKGCGDRFISNPRFPHTAGTQSVKSLMAGLFDVSRHLESLPTNRSVRLNHRAAGSNFESSQAQPPSMLDSSNTVVSNDQVWTCQPFGDTPIGCMRIKYLASDAKHISLLAKLNGDGTSRGWRAPSSWICPRSSSHGVVYYFAPKASNSDDVIEEMLKGNASMTFWIRILGILLAWWGVHLFLQPIQAIADIVNDTMNWFSFIPLLGWALDFLGDVVSEAVGFVLVIVSFGVAVPTSLLVMSLMWFMMRPLVGIPMLLAGIAGIFLTGKKMVQLAQEGRLKKGKAERAHRGLHGHEYELRLLG